MDVGSTPSIKYTKDYQSGALSFEIITNGKKLISNCGYYNGRNKKLNKISKSTAAQSTLVIDDQSSSKIDNSSLISKGLKVIKKNSIFKKNYWKINAAHDGYLKHYGIIHDREIEFYPEQFKFIGHDKIISKKSQKNLKFEIRFHLEPDIKVMKTQDNKSILIDLKGEGWKFSSNINDIIIDQGLYFGKKNFYTDNQNITISGMTNNENQTIKWEIAKLR